MRSTSMTAADPVHAWTLANERVLRTYPDLAGLKLLELVEAMGRHFAAKRVAPDRVHRMTVKPYRVPTQGDAQAVADAAAKRERKRSARLAHA